MSNNKPKIQPKISIAHINIEQNAPTEKEPAIGSYTLVAIKDGQEFGAEFTIGARTYNRTYRNNPNFVVKKNPQ